MYDYESDLIITWNSDESDYVAAAADISRGLHRRE